MRLLKKIREKIGELCNSIKKEKELHSLFETGKEQELFIKALEENMLMMLGKNEKWDVYKTESLEYGFQSNNYVAQLQTTFTGNLLLTKVYEKEKFGRIWSKRDYVSSLYDVMAHPKLSFYYPLSHSRLVKWKQKVSKS